MSTLLASARRRNASGGFVPPTGCKLWLPVDGAALGSIATWADTSGNNNDATQASGANQPVGVATILNGHKVVRFTISTRSWLAIPDTSSLQLTNQTIFVVGSSNNSGGYAGFYNKAHEAPWSGAGVVRWGGSNKAAWWIATDGADLGNFNADQDTATNAIQIITAKQSGSLGQIYINGVPQSASVAGVPIPSTDPSSIGRFYGTSDAYYLDGDIGEIFVFDSALSDSDMDRVGNYIAGWSGLPWINLSTFAPRDIAGCELWLPSRLLTGTSGDVITTELDQSGNGNNITATAAHEGTLQTGVLNGTNVLRFDGSSSDYTVGGSFSGSSWTFFYVITPSSTTPVGLLDTGSGSSDVFRNYSPGHFEWQGGASAALGLANTNPVIICVRTSLTPSQFIQLNINGGTTVTGSNASTTPIAWVTKKIGSINSGGAGYFQGDVGEVIWYNSTLSDADVNRVGNYIAGWSGITWTDI